MGEKATENWFVHVRGERRAQEHRLCMYIYISGIIHRNSETRRHCILCHGWLNSLRRETASSSIQDVRGVVVL